jgi:hypothetical protein
MCVQVPRADGLSCGDERADACSAADSCQQGRCDANDALSGTACGDVTAASCTAPDSCDGRGQCLANHMPPGAVCGEAANACLGERRCDGEGSCRDAPTINECGSCGTVADHVCTAGTCGARLSSITETFVGVPSGELPRGWTSSDDGQGTPAECAVVGALPDERRLRCQLSEAPRTVGLLFEAPFATGGSITFAYEGDLDAQSSALLQIDDVGDHALAAGGSPITFPLEPGSQLFNWLFFTNTGSTGTKTFYIDDVVFDGIVSPEGFDDALPSPFETDVVAGFAIDSSKDRYGIASSGSLRSGPAGSTLTTTIELSRDGFIEFAVTTDSQAGDALRFSIDGEEQQAWSGSAPNAWQRALFRVEAGSHALEWTYDDGMPGEEGMDSAWIDDFVAVPDSCP